MEQQDKLFIELLERWQQGDFSAADEQKLRQRMADGDEFQRMALEGYLNAAADEHSERLARLHDKIRGPKSPKQPVAGFSRMRISGIAAAIALLIFAGWWAWNISNQGAVLTQTNPNPQVPDRYNETVPADEMAGATTSSLGDNRVADTPSGPTSASEKAKVSPEDGRGIAAAAPASTLDDAPQFEQEDKTDMIRANETTEQPAETRTATDAAATPPEEELVAKVEVALKKPGAASVPPQSTKPAPAEMRKIPAKQTQDFGNPYPEGGWVKFEQLVRNKAILTPAARNANVRGTVTFLIDFNSKSEITKISTLSSLGYGCDEIAERIVRSVKWMVPGKEQSVIVDIPFEQ